MRQGVVVFYFFGSDLLFKFEAMGMLGKNLSASLLLMSFLLFFSSCFQVIEEINMKKNGSGEATLTINLSQSKAKVASILLLDSIHGYKVPSRQEIQKQLNEAANYLKKSDGISNIKKKIDFNTYIATLSFSFKDISNLNSLSKNILTKQKIKFISNSSSYSFNKTKSVFERNYQYIPEAKKQYGKLKEEDKAVFKNAQYTSIYRFEEPVQTYSNRLANVSKSKKAIMLQVAVLDLINGKINLSNTIQLFQ